MNKPNYTELAKKFYEHLANGSIEDIKASFSEEIRWVNNQLPENVPFGGEYLGKRQVMGYLDLIYKNLDMKIEISDYICEGNTVVALGTEDATAKPTGRKYHIQWAHIIRYSDSGLIDEMVEYVPTAAIADAFKASSL